MEAKKVSLECQKSLMFKHIKDYHVMTTCSIGVGTLSAHLDSKRQIRSLCLDKRIISTRLERAKVHKSVVKSCLTKIVTKSRKHLTVVKSWQSFLHIFIFSYLVYILKIDHTS